MSATAGDGEVVTSATVVSRSGPSEGVRNRRDRATAGYKRIYNFSFPALFCPTRYTMAVRRCPASGRSTPRAGDDLRGKWLAMAARSAAPRLGREIGGRGHVIRWQVTLVAADFRDTDLQNSIHILVSQVW
jgi:hypothetical protein